MSFFRNIFYCVQLILVISSPQINLYFTDWINSSNNEIAFQQDCLYVTASIKKETDPHQIISYCLTELPLTWNIQENNFDKKFTFIELFQQNITSQQLYIWSAPIDIIERYQFYLNQISISNNLSSISLELYYNCTSPRFGSLCQYSFDISETYYTSLYEIILNYYQYKYEPNSLTCYIHLECNRGSTLSCLDWTEICDRYIDCQNGIDEEYCWQLEINECKENEYRCDNGQCIPKIFFHDDNDNFECLDRSDEISGWSSVVNLIGEPTFTNEDITCPWRYFHITTKFTNSCVQKRNSLLEEIILLDTPNSLSDLCWLAFKCEYTISISFDPKCHNFCGNETCKQIINRTCPDILIILARPLIFDHIYFAYLKKSILNSSSERHPQYVCYNNQLCSGFHSNESLLIFNNTICHRPEDFPIKFPTKIKSNWINKYIPSLFVYLYQCNTIIYNHSTICNNLNMYQCINSSKCISKYRLCDGLNDCIYKDDEECNLNNNICLIYNSEILFKCLTTNKCISLKRYGNGLCDCGLNKYGLCDDEIYINNYIKNHISFPTICDGFTELLPIIINDENHTDETECQYWQCNNIYTKCNGFWNCLNGIDEIDCNLSSSSSSLLKCPYQHHICVSPYTYKLMCLPISKANDGYIDCIGATDEPQLCRSNTFEVNEKNFYCQNDTIQICIPTYDLCDSDKKCMYRKTNQLCYRTQTNGRYILICRRGYESIRSDTEKFLCERFDDTKKAKITYFSIDTKKESNNKLIIQKRNIPIDITSNIYQCHRGLPLRVWLNINKNLSTIACLCPPSFYGNMCQYQNQRISLTLVFQTSSHSRQTLFTLIILLIDNSNEQIIHSYQQLTYIYIRHCQIKFNIYLLYSIRPKNLKKNYFIHIDIYEKISFGYRASFLIPLNYIFLPVHRLAFQIDIPHNNHTLETCSNYQCIHGRCIKYINNPKDNYFCQCYQGWSGKYCTIPYTCTCSLNSLCIGISANNRSICICPINRWGPRCLIHSTICQSNQNITCLNDGLCVPVEENLIPNEQFLCICRKGFSGKRCEINDNKIIVTFDKDIILPQVILVHFIRVINNGPPENGSTFKNIPIGQNSIIIHWSHPFHIIFIELFDNNFYLITVQNQYKQSEIINKIINSSDHCKHIKEILNETIIQYHLIRRIKYYHLVCQKESLLFLSCFYDENYFCLCNYYENQRLANCFEFNSSIEHNCFGQSNCENNAQCLQDKPNCPQTSMCVCPICYYGTRCQFSSTLFGLSLDAILGYHIQPNISIRYQLPIIQFSIILTIIMTIIGFINGILSLITFKNKELQKNGSGLYLISSSISTIFTIIIFSLKFWLLILIQMAYINNQTFIYIQCISIDFLLRIGLNIDQWLNACVAIERAMTTIKGIHFNKIKSKQIAKYIIIFIIVLIIITTIHDPIYRRLIDDNDEKRIWCIVTYSSKLQIFNLIINIFHFFTPFIINLISVFIIIKNTTKQRLRIHVNKTYRKLFFIQFQRYSHLFLAPLLLIILALPRLIISFTSGCMKSNNDSWLFLIGYFISFIPSTLTFLVFVLPSKLYKQHFFKSIKQYRRSLRENRIYPIS